MLEKAVTHYPRAGGKCTRPTLVFAFAELTGGRYTTVFPVGVGLEMIHISTLVGDDHPTMDDDDFRRGVPTVHRKYNNQDSLLAANLLLSRGIYTCSQADLSGDKKSTIRQRVDELVRDLCEGQHTDMKYTDSDSQLTEQEYQQLIAAKTASLYRTAAECGVIGSCSECSDWDSGDETYRQAAREIGHHVGIAHQLFNDVADFETDRKHADSLSDITSGTQTLVTIIAENRGVPIFDDSVPVAERVTGVEETGSKRYVWQKAREHLEVAVEKIKQLPVAPGKEQYQERLCEYLSLFENMASSDGNRESPQN